MSQYTAEQVGRIANKLRYSGTDEFSEEAADVMDAYAATLRQQAGRVDEGMVDAVRASIMEAAANDGHTHVVLKDEWVRAALAQNTQGATVVGYVLTNGQDGVIDFAVSREAAEIKSQPIGLTIRPVVFADLHAERARVPSGWALVPIEPTEEMLAQAATHDTTPRTAETDQWNRDTWSFMLDGAPEYAAPSQRAEVK